MLFENINPRHSTQLYGLDLEFDRLSNLLSKSKVTKSNIAYWRKRYW